LRAIYLATVLTSLIAGGIFTWWASFMIRVHHLDLTTVGLISTIGLGLCGVLGSIAAGYITDWARGRSRSGPLFVICATSLINLVFSSLAIWIPSTPLMVAALCIGGATAGAYIVPRGAALSELAPPHLHGLAFTIPIVIASMIGFSLGPLVVGAISDYANTVTLGVEPLRLAMSSILLLQIPVALIYFIAARGLSKRTDLAENDVMTD